MEIMLIISIFYVLPILIICVIMYLLMKKGQTIKEFMEETDCISPDFIIPMIMPFINIGLMLYSIVFYVYYKFKDWRK